MLNLQLINTGLILSTGSIEHALSLCVYYDLYDVAPTNYYFQLYNKNMLKQFSYRQAAHTSSPV